MANGLNRRAFNKSAYDYWGGQYGVVNVRDFGAVGDGVHDDTAAIQAAVNSSQGERAVYFTRTLNQYVISGSLIVPSHVRMIIDGDIYLANGANASIIVLPVSATDIIFEGKGTLNGNRTNQTGVSGGITFPNGGNCNNIIIRGLTITEILLWPMNIVDCYDVELEYLKISNCGNATGFASTSPGTTYRCHASKLRITSINDYGFSFYGGPIDCSIKNSYIYGNQNGISVYNDASQPNASSDILIQGNFVYGNQRVGIAAASSSSLNPHKNIQIIGNDIYNNNTANEAGAGGSDVWVSNSDNGLITDNLIHDSGNGSNGAAGVYLYAAMRYRVQGNQIFNEGVGSNASGAGIVLTVDTVDCTIDNNDFFDTQSTPTMHWGIQESAAPTGAVVSNNRFDASISVPIADFSTVTSYKNQGLNPIGSVTPPASPLVSGTVYQNTFGVDIAIYQPAYATAAGTAGTVAVALGSSSTPSTIYTQWVNGSTTSSLPEVVPPLRVPSGWYYSFTATGATLLNANIQGE